MRFWRSVLNHLYPSHYNAHRPHVLRRQWLFALLGLALVSEAIILGHSSFMQGPQVFLAAVVRSDVIQYTAEARVLEGGSQLRESELLNKAAQAKADDMAARGYFSHNGPDGEAPWTWLDTAGYEYVYAGENLAVRFDDSKDVVDAWMASPTHRANITKRQYQEVGVGLAEGTYKGGPATFVVQFFAAPVVASASTPTAPEVSVVPQPSEPTVAQATDVAGAEVSPVQAPAPGPSTAVPTAEPAPEPAVAPAAVAQTAQPTQSFARVAMEFFGDSRTGAAWALALVASLLVVVIALTFFIRIQVQPTDLLVPAAAVALVAITLIGVNAKFLPDTQSQSASVVQSVGGDIGQGVSTERVRVAFPEATQE
jgi:hypothetical protein